MNKEYTYINGKVIVEDEKYNKRLEEYSDKLDEILVQENLIETLEKNISKLEQQERKLEKYKNNNKYIPCNLIFSIIVIPLLFNCILKMFGITWSVFLSKINIIFVPVLYAINIFFVSVIEFLEYEEFKTHKKEAKGIKKELQYAREQLILAKEKLEFLNNTKTFQNPSSEFKVVKVNDLEILKKLKENLEMYFNLGYSSKESKEKQYVLKKKR